MRIGIPVNEDLGLESPTGAHFGHAPLYALVELDTMEVSVIPNESNHAGGDKLPPEWLNEMGVELLLCGGMGQRAIDLFEKFCIPVYFGEEPTAGEMIEAYKEDRLRLATSEDGCTH